MSAQRRFQAYVDTQITEVGLFSVPAKRCGFIPPVVNFAALVLRAERQVPRHMWIRFL